MYVLPDSGEAITATGLRLLATLVSMLIIMAKTTKSPAIFKVRFSLIVHSPAALVLVPVGVFLRGVFHVLLSVLDIFVGVPAFHAVLV
jgi:hypothetical protein